MAAVAKIAVDTALGVTLDMSKEVQEITSSRRIDCCPCFRDTMAFRRGTKQCFGRNVVERLPCLVFHIDDLGFKLECHHNKYKRIQSFQAFRLNFGGFCEFYRVRNCVHPSQ